MYIGTEQQNKCLRKHRPITSSTSCHYPSQNIYNVFGGLCHTYTIWYINTPLTRSEQQLTLHILISIPLVFLDLAAQIFLSCLSRYGIVSLLRVDWLFIQDEKNEMLHTNSWLSYVSYMFSTIVFVKANIIDFKYQHCRRMLSRPSHQNWEKDYYLPSNFN